MFLSIEIKLSFQFEQFKQTGQLKCIIMKC